MTSSYRLFLGALVAITILNLVLFLQQGGGRQEDSSLTPEIFDGSDEVAAESTIEKLDSIWLSPTYRLFRQLDDAKHLFLLDPLILAKVVGREALDELKWRFNLSLPSPNHNSVTLGMFANRMSPTLFNKSNTFREIARIEGPLPFDNNSTVLQHLFFVWQDPTADLVDQQETPLLHIHIVILHPVKHFLWLGQIPEPTIDQLTSSKDYSFAVHFGHHEEIFDRFGLKKVNSVTSIPKNIFHFLSQLPTSRYLHCPPEKNARWLEKNNVSTNQHRVKVTEESLKAIKSMMAALKMEFWVMCGTLLGWFRQCAPIPYTTDNDFSTWPKYIQGANDITELMKRTAPDHRLKLYYRFGSNPTRSMEYSFVTKYSRDKVDLFFTYSNGTDFQMAIHMPWKHLYQHAFYPPYSLCSIELLGWKLLAPCTAEEIITTEYGPNWDKPQVKYDYSKSPHNLGPVMAFPRYVSQFEEF